MKSPFNTALALSLGLHLALLGSLPHILVSNVEDKKPKQPKIEFVEVEKKERIRLTKKNAFQEPPPYVDLKNDLLSLGKTKNTVLRKPTVNKTALSAKEVVFVKSKEELDSFPAYINYYERIREKVRQAAYSSFHSTSSGRVFLNFTVDNLGNLLAVYLDERSSSRSERLRTIAKKSIEVSSPFPEFPVELKQFQTLTFNLSIHFRNN